MSLSSDLNLELAWEKTKRNLSRNDKIFINNPYITEIIDHDRSEYIEQLSQKLDSGYSPSDSRTVSFPKKDWNVRPASVLKITDLTIYSAIIIELYDDIRSEIQWSAQDRRFSRILLDDISENSYWMENPFKSWKQWNEKSQTLYNEYEYVLSTDISSYFENVEHRILDSNLREITDNEKLRDLLWKFLARWNRPKGRGLPQGYYPSNILSELYLNRIDKRIKSEGYDHTRYGDDLKIYCRNRNDAINMLNKLSELYRNKGLYINKSKTEILTSKEAKRKFKDPREIIKQLQPKIVDRIRQEREDRRKKIKAKRDKDSSDSRNYIPYTDGGEIDESDIREDEEIILLGNAFKKHIEDSDLDNKSLFNYLVRNLGDVNSHYAVPYCLDRIKDGRTQIRRIVDKYFSKLNNRDEIANKLISMILNEEIIYEFQKFVIVRWIFQSNIKTKKTISGMRRLFREPQQIPETRNYIIAYLGKYGDKTDVETISEEYPKSNNPVQKSIILMAIRDMDPEIRGAFYNQASKDHQYCKSSVALAKNISG
jgi:retron-type reverse transcriptase